MKSNNSTIVVRFESLLICKMKDHREGRKQDVMNLLNLIPLQIASTQIP